MTCKDINKVAQRHINAFLQRFQSLQGPDVWFSQEEKMKLIILSLSLLITTKAVYHHFFKI